MRRINIIAIFIGLLTLAGCGAIWNPGVRIYDVQNWSVPATYTNGILVVMDNGSIQVIEGDSADIEITVSNYVDAGGYTYGTEYIQNNINYTLDTNTNAIYFEHNAWEDVDYWNVYAVGADVVIKLPAGMTLEDLNIRTTTGSVKVSGVTVADTLRLNTTTGSVEAETVSATHADIDVTTGNVDVGMLTASDCTMDTTTGNVSVKDVSAGTLAVRTTTGNVTLDNVVGSSLRVETTSGSLTDGEKALSYQYVTCLSGTGQMTMIVKDLTSADFNVGTGNVELSVVSFLGAGTSDIEVTTGNVTLAVAETAQANLAVEAQAAVGNVVNRIDFAIHSETQFSFSGSNGSKANAFNLNVTTGNIKIKDYSANDWF